VSRLYGESWAYGEAHRVMTTKWRDIHRLVQTDRDWTEHCYWCYHPLRLIEEVLNRGQKHFRDKATRATQTLSRLSGIEAGMLVVTLDRPPGVEAELEKLDRRKLELERAFPPVAYQYVPIDPYRGKQGILEFSPKEWFDQIRAIHRGHHVNCPKIPEVERPRLDQIPRLCAVLDDSGHAEQMTILLP